jgi:branched-subunit amino acid aminotransferase/4-amino-4-deoxychorismate lyase
VDLFFKSLPEMLVRLAIQQRSADVSNSYLPWAYFDRRFVPVSEARLPVGCHAVQYGQGVFAGIRGYLDQDGSTINVFRLPDHFKRFVQSASIIKVTPPGPPEALAEILVELTGATRRLATSTTGRLPTTRGKGSVRRCRARGLPSTCCRSAISPRKTGSP